MNGFPPSDEPTDPDDLYESGHDDDTPDFYRSYVEPIVGHTVSDNLYHAGKTLDDFGRSG